MSSKSTNEYYKVSFITTHSKNIPNTLRYTGGLVVMSDLTDKDPSTKTNRMSLWLHGNCIASGWGFRTQNEIDTAYWWNTSYNDILGPLVDNGDGTYRNYFEAPDGMEDTPDIAYSYNPDGSIKGIVGQPYSIENRLKYVTSTALSQINDIKGTIVNQLEDKINSYYNKVEDQISYLNDYNVEAYNAVTNLSKRYYESSMTYTYAWIRNLVGNSAETLDNLQEIKNLLDQSQAGVIQTVEKLASINSYTMQHDSVDGVPPIVNDGAIPDGIDDKYTYLTKYSYQSVLDKSNPKKATYTYYVEEIIYDETTGTYIPEWVSMTGEYYTYDYKHIATGKNAIHADQVCCEEQFGNHTLMEVLKKIIAPYDYKVPTISFESINDVKYEDWVEDLQGYGEEVDFTNSIVSIDKHDSQAVQSIQITPSDENWSTNPIDLGDDLSNVDISSSFKTVLAYTPTVVTKEDLLNFVENNAVCLSTYAKTSYSSATYMEYPQLVGMTPAAISYENWFDANIAQCEIENTLTKKHGYYVFYGESNPNIALDDSDIPSSVNQVKLANKKFISNTGVKDIWVNMENNTAKVWLAIPKLLVDDSIIKIKSYNSNIEQVLSVSSDVLKKRVVDGKDFQYAGLDYSIIAIENAEFIFAEKVAISIYW